jgi:hypothetical protein
MLSAISKRYHPSIGKSVTSFMVGRREKACYLPALQNDAIWPVATNFSLGPDVSFQGEAEVGRAAEFAASVRGRDGRYRPPPAQNRASGIPARGSHLGCVTAKRMFGHG